VCGRRACGNTRDEVAPLRESRGSTIVIAKQAAQTLTAFDRTDGTAGFVARCNEAILQPLVTSLLVVRRQPYGARTLLTRLWDVRYPRQMTESVDRITASR